jgi:hypothetical protein
VQPPKDWSEAGFRDWLIEQVQDVLGVDNIKPDADLFEQGLDRYEYTLNFLGLCMLTLSRCLQFE